MYSRYFKIFLLGHLLGDFYIQTGKMADRKEYSLKWVLIHSLCYEGINLIITVPILSMILPIILLGCCHFLIDCLKYVFLKIIRKSNKYTYVSGRNSFIIDQIIHICLIAFISYWLKDIDIAGWRIIEDFFALTGISAETAISWLLALLLIHKPANILIQKLLTKYKPDKKDEDKANDKNAGRFIGNLERIIMLIFWAIGQYSAIGLVLTAKSIARYDRIAKEKDFAEYYLLGTLLSTLIAIVCSFIVK